MVVDRLQKFNVAEGVTTSFADLYMTTGVNDVISWAVLPSGDPVPPDRGLHGRETKIHKLDRAAAQRSSREAIKLHTRLDPWNQTNIDPQRPHHNHLAKSYPPYLPASCAALDQPTNAGPIPLLVIHLYHDPASAQLHLNGTWYSRV